MTEKITEHTPGPYEVNESTYIYADNGQGKQVVVGMAYSHEKDRDLKSGWPTARANALLFSASPDLLQAAIEAEGALAQAELGHHRESSNLRKAIRKAKGWVK